MKRCQACEDPCAVQANLCGACARIRDRFGAGKPARTAALVQARDPLLKAFVCYYSGIPLDVSDSGSPWYLSFDHRTPGDESSLVVCAASVNAMKGCHTEREFRRLVVQLAERFDGKRERIEVFQPEHWPRPRSRREHA